MLARTIAGWSDAGMRWSLSAFALAGCVGVEYGGTGGAGGAGGSADTSTSTVSTSSIVAGSTSTATGAPACTPVPESCNGVDDDCDGTADEPDAGEGEACGCAWSTRDGRLYAQCPGSTDLKSSCPGGMRAVVLEDAVERAYVGEWLLAVQSTDGTTTALVGLAQDPKANDAVEGWAWIGAEGMPIGWSGSDPRDDDDPFGDPEPLPIENHAQDCAALIASMDGNVALRDVVCGPSAMRVVVCEQDDATCVDGAPCQRPHGCTGTFDCTRPELSRCVGVPQAEVCDGLDNDCDGLVDASTTGPHACECSIVVAGGTTFRVCEKNQVVPHCGPGYRPAIPASASASATLFDQLSSIAYRLGAYQPEFEIAPDKSWRRFDGTPLTTLYWGADEPDEVLPLFHQCLTLTNAGWSDWSCSQALPYVCEVAP